ncbi:hypothetical protein V8V88_17270 [Paenibacillus phytohabitans]
MNKITKERKGATLMNQYHNHYHFHYPSRPDQPGDSQYYLPQETLTEEFDLGRVGHFYKSGTSTMGEFTFQFLGISRNGMVSMNIFDTTATPVKFLGFRKIHRSDLVGLEYIGPNLT